MNPLPRPSTSTPSTFSAAVGRITASIFFALVFGAGTAAADPDRRVADAAQGRDWSRVRSLLKQKADVNGTQADGGTALHWAAYYSAIDVARDLLQAGATANPANQLNVTPLALAAQNGNAEMGRLLLSKGADPNTPLGTGETPLMTAAETGNADLVKAMLAAGGNPNVSERTQDQTPLMWAAVEKHSAVTQALIEAGANLHARAKGGSTALLFAARGGNLESAKHLLKAGADVNATMLDGHTPLMVAAASGHGDLGLFLLANGADPNAATKDAGVTSLHALILKRPLHSPYWKRPADHLALAKALLAHGANANAQLLKSPPPAVPGAVNVTGAIWPGSTPFILAARCGDLDMLEMLAGHSDPAITTTNRTNALMAAAGAGRTEGNEDPVSEVLALAAVKFIAPLGIDVNAADTSGDTALHNAVNNGYNGVIQYLHERGADLNPKDKEGWTPLNHAEIFRNNFREHKEAAALLRKLGAQENVPPPPAARTP